MMLKNRIRRRPADAALPDHAIELLGHYFPRLDLRNIRIREAVPWYVPMDAMAYTDRNVIYFKPGTFDPDSAGGLAHIAHELTHAAQYADNGKWRFRALYIGSWLKNLFKHRSFLLAYAENRYEDEARRVARVVLADLLEKGEGKF